MSEDAKMWETLQCLPDAVEHLIHGDPDDADSVKASDAVKWAIAEIARLRLERRWVPVGERLPDNEMPVMVLSAGIAFIACASWGRWLDLGGIDRNLSNVTHWQPLPPGPKTKDEHNVPLQK